MDLAWLRSSKITRWDLLNAFCIIIAVIIENFRFINMEFCDVHVQPSDEFASMIYDRSYVLWDRILIAPTDF